MAVSGWVWHSDERGASLPPFLISIRVCHHHFPGELIPIIDIDFHTLNSPHLNLSHLPHTLP